MPNATVPLGLSLWNAANYKSSTQKTNAAISLDEMGGTYGRFSAEINSIANRRSSRTWTDFDNCIDPLVARGKKLLVGLTYGPLRDGAPTGDSWDCTDTKTLASLSTADRTALKTLLGEIVNRVISKGYNIRNWDVIFTIWNEPDKTTFGATSAGVFRTIHKDLMDEWALYLTQTFPGIKIAAPSFADQDTSYNWTAVTAANMSTGGSGSELRPLWRLASCVDLHIYGGPASLIPPRGIDTVADIVQESFTNWDSQISAIYGPECRLLKIPMIVSETNLNYVNAGMNTSGWEYGDQETMAMMQAASLLQVMSQPRIKAVSVYLNQNVSAGDDARSNNECYGMKDYSGYPTARQLMFARLNGISPSRKIMTAAEAS